VNPIGDKGEMMDPRKKRHKDGIQIEWSGVGKKRGMDLPMHQQRW